LVAHHRQFWAQVRSPKLTVGVSHSSLHTNRYRVISTVPQASAGNPAFNESKWGFARYLPACLPACLPVCVSVCLSVCASHCLTVSLSLCLSAPNTVCVTYTQRYLHTSSTHKHYTYVLYGAGTLTPSLGSSGCWTLDRAPLQTLPSSGTSCG
jgi:hypothetical protein